jgi:cytochrome b subunit of formate dehydrogenase
MGCVGYNLGARMVFTVLVGHAIVKHLSGAIMGQDSFIPVANRVSVTSSTMIASGIC